MPARKLKQVERARNVCLRIEYRLGERRSHARTSSKVDDDIKLRLFEYPSERNAVAYVCLVEFELFAPHVRRDVAALDGGVVEVVEVVNHMDTPATLAEQTPDQV